jgi:hypothetical protein
VTRPVTMVVTFAAGTAGMVGRASLGSTGRRFDGRS